MRKTLNILSIIGVITFCFKYFLSGKISAGLALFFLVLVVILAALDSVLADFIKVAVALFGLGSLLVGYFFDMKSFMSFLQPILVALIALFGIYFIVKEVFGSKPKSKTK